MGPQFRPRYGTFSSFIPSEFHPRDLPRLDPIEPTINLGGRRIGDSQRLCDSEEFVYSQRRYKRGKRGLKWRKERSRMLPARVINSGLRGRSPPRCSRYFRPIRGRQSSSSSSSSCRRPRCRCRRCIRDIFHRGTFHRAFLFTRLTDVRCHSRAKI